MWQHLTTDLVACLLHIYNNPEKCSSPKNHKTSKQSGAVDKYEDSNELLNYHVGRFTNIWIRNANYFKDTLSKGNHNFYNPVTKWFWTLSSPNFSTLLLQ